MSSQFFYFKPMSHQSEAVLENNLIKQLVGLGYALVKVTDVSSLLGNLKIQLEAFNQATYTDKEFEGILNHLAKGKSLARPIQFHARRWRTRLCPFFRFRELGQ
jgi:hypothetical protein